MHAWFVHTCMFTCLETELEKKKKKLFKRIHTVMQPPVLRQCSQAKQWSHHRGSFRVVVRSVRCLVFFEKTLFLSDKIHKRLKER